MPIYEYRCDNCDHELEAMQKLSEDKLVDCPECGKDSLIKKISAAGFRLKGSGWYETDFKSGNKKNVSGSENSDNSGGSESSPNTSDSSSSSSSGETKSTSDASGSSNSSSSKSTSSKSTSSKSTSKD